jgi:hypothetical protein
MSDRIFWARLATIEAGAGTTENRMSTPILGLVCPSCRIALVMSERQGIEIDYCP